MREQVASGESARQPDSATQIRYCFRFPLPLGRQFWDARFLSLENDLSEKTWSRYHDRLGSEHGIQALIA